MKKKMVGYYDYTVILTYCGMLFAFYGILLALSQSYWEAVFCLMLAGVCDMFDGAVAATRIRNNREKMFGIQIDSLSDLISFGVFPGIFVYIISGKNAWIGLVASIYVLCALIRLAYFNVLEEERHKLNTEKRKSYLGIPVTSIAVLLPIAYLLYDCRVYKSVICFPILLGFVGAGFLAILYVRKIQGKLHCVRPIALRVVPVFAQNSREYQVIETDQFGTMIQMEIGALLVGKIKNYKQPLEKDNVKAGEEKGYFEFGGSTILVLLKENAICFNEELYERQNSDGEIPVNMGECVAKTNKERRLCNG